MPHMRGPHSTRLTGQMLCAGPSTQSLSGSTQAQLQLLGAQAVTLVGLFV